MARLAGGTVAAVANAMAGSPKGTGFMGTTNSWGDTRVPGSPDSHLKALWGGLQALYVNVGNVAAGQAVTTLIAAGVISNPFPYATIYDIYYQVAGHENTPVGATNTIDVFDTTSAGTAAADSYLSTAFTIGAGLATGYRGESARHRDTPILFKQFDYEQSAFGNLSTWAQSSVTTGTRSIPVVFKQGQIFSVRAATTASTGALTGLQVWILLRPFDHPETLNR